MNSLALIKNKNNATLISDLKNLISKERQVLSEILHHLKEIENRRLYLERGFPSLFAFLTEGLGYSEGAAQRRIQAMRLIKEIPEIEKKIESGELSLSVASQMQGFFSRESKKRKEEKNLPLTKTEKLDLVLKLEGSSTRKCEAKLAEIAPETALPKEKTRPISDTKVLVQFVADKDLINKIERLKELMSHQKGEGSYEEIFTKLVDMALDKLDPVKREQKREKRIQRTKKTSYPQVNTLPPAPAVEKVNRHIPNAIRDKVWIRDKGRCGYVDPVTGKVCGSRHRLQIDHKYPYSLGGEHSEKNLRLRCFRHNQYLSEEIFGEFKGGKSKRNLKGDCVR